MLPLSTPPDSFPKEKTNTIQQLENQKTKQILDNTAVSHPETCQTPVHVGESFCLLVVCLLLLHLLSASYTQYATRPLKKPQFSAAKLSTARAAPCLSSFLHTHLPVPCNIGSTRRFTHNRDLVKLLLHPQSHMHATPLSPRLLGPQPYTTRTQQTNYTLI